MNLKILFMISGDILFFDWKISYAKTLSYADALSQIYSYLITVEKTICRHHELCLILFRKDNWFNYSFPCCDSYTLVNNMQIVTKNMHLSKSFFLQVASFLQLWLKLLFSFYFKEINCLRNTFLQIVYSFCMISLKIAMF